jgi:uncharacterized protein (TIGR02145 family)
MADITYIVNQDLPENIAGFEQYSQQDRELLTSFTVNNVFNPSKNYIELHILSLSDELLESDNTYSNFTQLGNAQSAGQAGVSVLTVDPVYDSRIYGYDLGGVKLLYHFLNDLYTTDKSTTQFFVESISADRTEVRLLPISVKDSDLVTLTANVKTKLETQSYFDGFRLNFGNNDLFIAVNIDTVDIPQGKAVVVKLYEPLPDTYSEKSRLSIAEIVADSVAYEVDSDIVLDEVVQPTIRSANFNLEIADESVIPTEYLSYNDLFSYPVNNSNSEIYSLLNEKGVEISVDFNDYSNYVHFSSAEERLNNFKYKIDLINSYSASLASIQATNTSTSGSRTYYTNLISGIVSNFDHYERFLYYESGSSSWPKSNKTKPYQNTPSIDPVKYVPNVEVATWYSSQLSKAIYYDSTNKNSLANAIPNYLRDDPSNTNYLTFIYMIGQHFDNLWLYSKAVTDKYNADNRIDHGISKDLVGEALKNFGIKLYTSNKSIEDLFGSFIGQAYQSGSEDINFYITGSLTGSNTPIQPTSYDNYQKEVQKRIYHNLPLLLKSKGTERGLRALINCFGIPSDIFDIKLYGGRNINERPFYGNYLYYTSSLDKIRLDNTGSMISGSTLSQYTSITKKEYKYTDDLHSIELGFSPTDNVDNYITQTRRVTPLPSVTIGTQVWTNQNLDITTYRNGDPIPEVTDTTAWANLTTGAWCYYTNNQASGSIYGKLYNWYAVNDPRGLAPQGWHVPTVDEWVTLGTFLGGNSIAGGKLKATGITYWLTPNTDATNSSGFAGLPGGRRASNGVFDALNTTNFLWTSTDDGTPQPPSRWLRYDSGVLTTAGGLKRDGYSVRLVQDVTSSLIPTTFNIDDYLGDPRNLYQDNYYSFSPTGSITGSLDLLTDQIMSGSSAYGVYDFVRLIKFFDNTIFKMVKDFIPARTTASTGIIIKPHVLSRSKAKSVKLSGSRPEHTSSIDTAFTEGDSGGTFNSEVSFYNTSYVDTIQTPNGLSGPFNQQGINTNISAVTSHAHEEPRFNGELNNSGIDISDGELNRDNIYKAIENVTSPYNITFVSASNEICLLSPKAGLPTPLYITSSTATLNDTDFFSYTNVSSQYELAVPATSTVSASITFPTTIQSLQPSFPGLTQYSTGSIKVNNTNFTLGICTSSIDFIYATCSLGLTQIGQNINEVVQSPNLTTYTDYNLTTWFTNHPLQSVQYSITSASITTVITNQQAQAYEFPSAFLGSPITVTVSDPKAGPGCRLSKTVTVGNCLMSAIATGSNGLTFIYSKEPTIKVGVMLSQEIGDLGDYNAGPGRNSLGYSTTVLNSYSITNIKYIELTSPGSPLGRGLQGYFSEYPPDPGTTYSVFFVRKDAVGAYEAKTILANQTPADLAAYYSTNNIPPDYATNPNITGGGSPPIRIVTPFETQDPILAVRAIVIEAYPPNSPQCKRRMTLYPSTTNFGGIPIAGNAIFQLHDMYIDWSTAQLGTPLAGVTILAGVPIRIYQ